MGARVFCAIMLLTSLAPCEAMTVRTPTARRMWGKLAEGKLGMLAGPQRKQLNLLTQRAGGPEAVIEALTAVPSSIKADAEKLLDRLSVIFRLDDEEFTVLGTGFWHVSGGPAVELETDLFGGMHFVHGTHMRSWLWTRFFVRHPQLACALGESMIYALSLIAMLTCGPSVWRRICRQARVAPLGVRARGGSDAHASRACGTVRAGAQDALGVGHRHDARGALEGRCAQAHLPQ